MKFETGKKYTAKSICDNGAIFAYAIQGRTSKTATIKSAIDGRTSKRRIFTSPDGVEYLKPEGTYSFSPVLRADRAA